MIENPLPGEVYWCIRPSIETEAHDWDPEPREPWRGKYYYDRRPYLYRFNEETGQIDKDTNATAFVEHEDLYRTREEACEAYKNTMIRYIKIKEGEVLALRRQFAAWLDQNPLGDSL